MPVGRINYKGSLPLGRTNPVATGTAAARLAAKAGLGKTASANTPNPAAEEAMADFLGLRKTKASKGRQNVTSSMAPKKTAQAASPKTKPKRRG